MLLKNFHPFSFGVGILSGAIVVFLIAWAIGGFRGHPTPTGFGNSTYQQRGSGNGTMNLTRMAQRLGMTEADLQAELKTGKTLRDIATEHGVTLPMGGFGRRSGSGTMMTGSGSATGSGAGMMRRAMNSSASAQ